LSEKSKRENWSEEKKIKEAQRFENRLFFENALKKTDTYCHVRLEEIKKRFGEEKANAFWSNYISKRGELTNFQYLTERNLTEEKTLIEIKENVAFCERSSPISRQTVKAAEKN
jgi:hypothetical protein